MLDWLARLAQWHLLLWVIPALLAVACSGLGAWLNRFSLLVLVTTALGWPLLQGLAAGAWFLWGRGTATATLTVAVPGGQGLFALSFGLDALGSWAVALASGLGLAVFWQAQAVTGNWIGRHRYYALLVLVVAAANLLFTARSMLPILFGWEAVALAGAFLAGFWEAEEGRRRTGMRWLVFQHVGTVCLVVVWLVQRPAPELAAALLLAALAIRLGLPPFHGWVPEHSQSPSSAGALVHAVASLLAGFYLLHQGWSLLARTSWGPWLLGGLGLAGLLSGTLAAWQRQRAATTLAWLFVCGGGVVAMTMAAGDATAARLLLSGLLPVLAGAMLLLGGAAERLVGEGGSRAGAGLYWQAMLLAAGLAMPPALGALGLARGLAAYQPGWQSWVGMLAAAVLTATVVRVLTVLARSLRQENASGTGLSDVEPGSGLALVAGWLLAGLAPALGVALLVTHEFSPTVFGGWRGAGLFLVPLAAAVLGWLLGRLAPGRYWRLAQAGRLLGRAAGGGLLLGEFVVLLPLGLLRSAGVLVWRVLDDFLIDTMVVGTAFGTLEGLGAVMRLLHNGRLQRYLFLCATVVLLLLLLLRN